MRRNKLTLLCVLLLVLTLSMCVVFAGCDDPEKKEATITADPIQRYAYDGQEHAVVATLDHDETELTYSPQKSYSAVGDYFITVSAAETEHYKATSVTVQLSIYDDTPPETTMSRWENFTTALKQAYAIDSKSDVRFSVQAQATLSPDGDVAKTYALDAMGNLDLTDAQNNASVFHAVFRAQDTQIGIYYQDAKLYLELGDQLFAFNNTDLSALLTKRNTTAALATSDDDSMLDSIVALLPILLFRDLDDIVCEDHVWQLTLDVSAIWEQINVLLSSDIAAGILSEQNLEILNNLFSENPTSFVLSIDLTTANAPKANATVDIDTYGQIQAQLSAMEITNGSFDVVTGKLTPEQIAAAHAINVANVQMSGNLDLVNIAGEVYEHLQWKLTADIDPIALAAAIQTAAAGDNPMAWVNDPSVQRMKVHFQLYHTHRPAGDIACTDAMCPTRSGGMEDTTLLDVAFDPQAFGDSRLYVAANLSRFLSQKSLGVVLSNISGLASLISSAVTPLLEQNFLVGLDLTKMVSASEDDGSDPSDPEDPFVFDVYTMLDPIVSVLTQGIRLDGGVTLDMELLYNAIDAMIDLNSKVNISLGGIINVNADNIRDAVFKGLLSPDEAADTEKQFRSLRLSIDSIRFGAGTDYDCKEAITHDPIDDAKERTFGGHNPLAFQNANAKATGRVYRFNGKSGVVDEFTAADGIWVTPEEASQLIGKNVEYTYTATDGKTYTATSQIVSLPDLSNLPKNTVSTVTATVLPLDGKGGMFSDGLFQLFSKLYGSFAGGFLPAHIAIPLGGATLPIDLTVTTISTATFAPTKELEESYELTPLTSDPDAKLDLSQYLSGKIELTYANGKTKTVDATVTNDLIEGKYLVNDGNVYTVTYAYGADPSFSKTYTVRATTPSLPALIKNDDAGLDIEYFAPTHGLTLNAVLKSSSATFDPSLYRVKYDGTLLSELNLDSDAAKRVTLLEDAGAITVEFDRTKADAVKNAKLYFYLTSADGKTGPEVLLNNTYYEKEMQDATWGYVSGATNLHVFDGKITYKYWLDSDDAYAKARILTLEYDEAAGKFYMVGTDPVVKIEADFTAWKTNKYATNDKVAVDEKGMLQMSELRALAYNTASKSTKSVSLYLQLEFELNGKPVQARKSTSQSFNNMTLGSVSTSNVAAETPFGGLLKFTIVASDWTQHTMQMTYVDGKYVLRDSATTNRIDDIEVTVTAIDYTTKDPIALTDGVMLPADAVDKKVTLTGAFTFDGKAFSYKFVNNRPVVAKA